MCWSAFSSFVGGIMSLCVAYAVRTLKPGRLSNVYACTLVGVTSMQFAEGFIWYFGHPQSTTVCSVPAMFGRWVLVPVAICLQALAPCLSIWWNQYSLSRYTVILYAIVCSLFLLVLTTTLGTLVMQYVDYQNSIADWYSTTCATSTEMGYLYWGAPTVLLPHLVWCIFVGYPLWAASIPYNLAICTYGLLCLLLSYIFTDSVGSNWCLYIVTYNVLCVWYIVHRK